MVANASNACETCYRQTTSEKKNVKIGRIIETDRTEMTEYLRQFRMLNGEGVGESAAWCQDDFVRQTQTIGRLDDELRHVLTSELRLVTERRRRRHQTGHDLQLGVVVDGVATRRSGRFDLVDELALRVAVPLQFAAVGEPVGRGRIAELEADGSSRTDDLETHRTVGEFRRRGVLEAEVELDLTVLAIGVPVDDRLAVVSGHIQTR